MLKYIIHGLIYDFSVYIFTPHRTMRCKSRWKQKTNRRHFSHGYLGHLAAIWIIGWRERWSHAWCAVWVEFSRFSTMILLPVLATFLLRIKTAYGAPHQTINAIQEQLKALGYSISSPDIFENSLRCDICQVTLKFQKSFQAVWFLRRHTREKAHQVKAGWILDDENNVQRSKATGKLKSSRIKCSWTRNNYLVLYHIQRVGQPLNRAVRWQAIWSLVNCVQTI